MENIKIVVAYHKHCPIIHNNAFIPIQVGKALHPNIELGIQGDNEGINISDENNYYCELTAIFWLWKNVQAHYKGLFHYRRFFTKQKRLNFRKILAPIYRLLNKNNYFFYPIITLDHKKAQIDTEKTMVYIRKILPKYPIITTSPVLAPYSCYTHFSAIGSEYLSILSEFIQEFYPQYTKVLENTFQSNKFYFANMSIMKDIYFNEYCTFLFDILEKIKLKLIQEQYLINLKDEKIFSRKLGYIAELLTNIYINKKKEESIPVKELDIVFIKE